jgi:hypothetical protein
LTQLRSELGEAQRRAEADKDDPLRLRVGPIELSLEVAYTLEKSGEASAGVKAKFWVLEFGEAGVKGTVSTRNMRTQHLKLMLTPRLERTEVDAQGQSTVVTSDLDVAGPVQATEAPIEMPPVGGAGG